MIIILSTILISYIPLFFFFFFFYSQLCSISTLRFTSNSEIVARQLSDLWSAVRLISPSSLFIGLFGMEVNLRLRIRLIAAIKCTVGSGGGSADRKFEQKFRCRFSASSALISRSHRTVSSFTASAHRPQIHFPWYRSRILSMYAGVHSSVNPQQSHFANSTSIAAATAAAAIFPAIKSVCAVLLVDIKYIYILDSAKTEI